MNDTKQNIQFNVVASTRDKEAAKYFTSQEFLDKAKDAFMREIVRSGRSAVAFRTEIRAKSQDQVYLDQALQTLKTEFPDINHLRVSEGAVMIDTKPNTLLRRLLPGSSGLIY